MNKANIPHNETVLIRNDQVYHNGEGGELVLTKSNLYFTYSKGTFITKYLTQKYPINQIKLFNGQAHIILEKEGKFEIFFADGSKSFRFWTNDSLFKEKKLKNEIMKWTHTINQLLTGQSDGIDLLAKTDSTDSELFTEALKDTFSSIKEVIGSKSKTQDVKKVERVAEKCTSCGAVISGIKGNVYKCQYCETDQKL